MQPPRWSIHRRRQPAGDRLIYISEGFGQVGCPNPFEGGIPLKIQTIVSDLDDTLLTRTHMLTPRTIRVLQHAQDLGIAVVLASGRCAASMRPFVEQVGTKMPFIAGNGAQIVSTEGEVLLEHLIDLPLMREILRFLAAQDVYAQLYYDDRFYFDTPCTYSAEYMRSSRIEGVAVGSLLAFAQTPTTKILAVAPPERVAMLLPLARAHFGARLSVMISKPFFLEFSHPLATKGQALAFLAARYGFPQETTLAAGDSLNDLPMLEWAGMPVTVANAHPDVQRMAWKIAGDGREDGIAALLETLLTEEQNA
ncbi:MAG: Cof-type HAD-IIB family hydrolase [Clostridia bacterium]